MTALNKQARLVSSARISEIANGANLIMGEKEWLANTAIYLANELKTATKAFQSTGLSLLEAEEKLEDAERQNGYLREQRDEWERKAISNFEECTEMSARIEELESQRKLAFTASNRWADKFREAEKRIAELEARDETKFVKCWSCKHDIEVLAIVDCDGYCPRCAAPIDLDEEPCAGIGVKGE
ncbi:hypothetical protein ACRZ6Q_000418 [Citrobacter freundii]